MQSAAKLKILLAEDDINTAFMLKENLNQSGYEVTHVPDGKAAVIAISSGKFDLALLDIMLPKKDGLQLAKHIRSLHRSLPVVFLTARNLLEDRIVGFKTGCDDYVTKPFHFEELSLRINAVLRRSGNYKNSTKQFFIDNVQFDLDQNTISTGSTEITLTPTESRIMEIFVIHFNQTLPRNFILEKIWGIADLYTSRTFDVYLHRIRKLLKELPLFEIENSHGLGFKLKPTN